MTFVAAGLVGVMLLLGLAMVPASVVPWPRAAFVLESHRVELAVFGAMSLFALGLFFVLTRVSA